jgi:hypothetical protein
VRRSSKDQELYCQRWPGTSGKHVISGLYFDVIILGKEFRNGMGWNELRLIKPWIFSFFLFWESCRKVLRHGLQEIVVEVLTIFLLQGMHDSDGSIAATEVSKARLTVLVSTDKISKEASYPSGVGIEFSASD